MNRASSMSRRTAGFAIGHFPLGFGHSRVYAMPFVYMLRCSDGSLYTGAAKDLVRRCAEHAAGRASRYTRARLPVALVWSRRVRSWSVALREEHRIKQLSRVAKQTLARSGRAVRPRARSML